MSEIFKVLFGMLGLNRQNYISIIYQNISKDFIRISVMAKYRNFQSNNFRNVKVNNEGYPMQCYIGCGFCAVITPKFTTV